MINTKTQRTHTTESRHKFKMRLCLLISGALSYTLHMQGSLHSCRPMIFYVAWTLIPKSTTTVIPLHHFSRNTRSGRYWNRLVRQAKGSSDWFLTLRAMRYLHLLPPPIICSQPPSSDVMVWYTIYNAPYTRGTIL